MICQILLLLSKINNTQRNDTPKSTTHLERNDTLCVVEQLLCECWDVNTSIRLASDEEIVVLQLGKFCGVEIDQRGSGGLCVCVCVCERARARTCAQIPLHHSLIAQHAIAGR